MALIFFLHFFWDTYFSPKRGLRRFVKFCISFLFLYTLWFIHIIFDRWINHHLNLQFIILFFPTSLFSTTPRQEAILWASIWFIQIYRKKGLVSANLVNKETDYIMISYSFIIYIICIKQYQISNLLFCLPQKLSFC